VTRDYSLDLLAERFEISREELDEIIEYEMPLAQATALGIASRIYDEIMKDDDES
jgi:plasmid maintenance system antidote protein VapI